MPLSGVNSSIMLDGYLWREDSIDTSHPYHVSSLANEALIIVYKVIPIVLLLTGVLSWYGSPGWQGLEIPYIFAYLILSLAFVIRFPFEMYDWLLRMKKERRYLSTLEIILVMLGLTGVSFLMYPEVYNFFGHS